MQPVRPPRTKRMEGWDQAVRTLTPDQRATLDRLIVLVIAFDSFSNPLQGWLMRRALKPYNKPVPVQELGRAEIRAAERQAIRVASRTGARKAQREMCAA